LDKTLEIAAISSGIERHKIRQKKTSYQKKAEIKAKNLY
jgi:hypothetical protein